GGATALAEHRPALDVGHRRQREHHPGAEKDQGRQPQPTVGDDADREVDREADAGGGNRVKERYSEQLSGSHPRSARYRRAAPSAQKTRPKRKPNEAGPPPRAIVRT